MLEQKLDTERKVSPSGDRRGRDNVLLNIRLSRLGTGKSLKKLPHCLHASFRVVFRQHLPGQGLHILLVQNLEVLRVAEPMDLLAQKPHAEPVDRADKVVRVPRRNKLSDPAPHLLRRLVREGKAQNVRRFHAQFVYYVRIPIG